jgi:hypothetical protein
LTSYVLKEYKKSELIEMRDIIPDGILDNPEHILYELLPEERKRDHPFILLEIRSERFLNIKAFFCK